MSWKVIWTPGCLCIGPVIIHLFYFNELDTFHNIHFTFYSQPNANNIITAIIYREISNSLKPKTLDLIIVNHIWRVGSVVKSTCCFCRGPGVQFSAPILYLISLCNFSLRGSNTIFWSPWSLGMCVVYIIICR